jgi:hypothetical protein
MVKEMALNAVSLIASTNAFVLTRSFQELI